MYRIPQMPSKPGTKPKPRPKPDATIMPVKPGSGGRIPAPKVGKPGARIPAPKVGKPGNGFIPTPRVKPKPGNGFIPTPRVGKPGQVVKSKPRRPM